ncbi:HlyD family type I secretion periplasmic adaptor subunit [Pseudohalocynthiibacter aestuariivivens]|nr:HlyD family type I secretion periplasmic adaptor subunit [Pseudohalocynthiibacter aestuariivivens]QIE46650.1 HlyD family type I secretion periplasmic adaptor subunit [Pseudohalocynthiibacter aestuariivivens]
MRTEPDLADAPVRGFLTLGALALVLLIGGFGVWASQAQIASALVVPAHVVSSEPSHVIQHPRGGVVAQVNVHEGQRVAAGEILLLLDAADLQSELVLVQAELNEVRARHARLVAERDGAARIRFPDDMAADDPALADVMAGQRSLLRARDALDAEIGTQLDQRMQLIAAQIAGLESQKDAVTTQQMVIAEELEDQQALLDKGLAQAGRVLALRREAARLAGVAGDLAAQVAQAHARIVALQTERQTLRTRRREEAISKLRDILHRERVLRERSRALRTRIAAQRLTAPVDGWVHDMGNLTRGNVVQPAVTMMQIVPFNRISHIEARVGPGQRDRVSMGQRVTLRFPSFDKGTSPELEGQITHLSADVLIEATTERAYYRIEIALAGDAATQLPEGIVLIAGMSAEAYMRTGDHTPLEYLIKPLGDYVKRALRE